MNELFERYMKEYSACAVYDEERFLERKTCCIDTNIPIIVYSKDKIEQVTKKIREFYGETELSIKDGIVGTEPKPLFEKTRFSYGDLLEIIKRLRDKDGCPWDRQQSPKTIRTNIIEEAYELIEAIDDDEDEKICEECGDVMLQGTFCSVMTEEDGRLTNGDVITRLCKKLIGRHTHIFGKDKATNAENALYYWEKAKAKEKGQKSVIDKLDCVPKTFTALQKAGKIQKIIKKTGFDFPTVEEAVMKIEEETKEFLEAKNQNKEKEGGDMLFSVVNVLRLFNIDPEVALFGTCERFEKRFRYIVEEAEKSGRRIEELKLEEMEELYNEAKKKLKE